MFGHSLIVGVGTQAGEIRAQVSASSFGPANPLPFWEDTAPVGQLPAGSYDVFLDVTQSTAPSVDFTYTCGPTSVSVLPGVAVPALSPAGAATLVVLLALLSVTWMRRP